jgi:hypothetical protein
MGHCRYITQRWCSRHTCDMEESAVQASSMRRNSKGLLGTEFGRLQDKLGFNSRWCTKSQRCQQIGD